MWEDDRYLEIVVTRMEKKEDKRSMSVSVSLCVYRAKGIMQVKELLKFLSFAPFLGGNMDQKNVGQEGELTSRGMMHLAFLDYVRYEVIGYPSTGWWRNSNRM